MEEQENNSHLEDFLEVLQDQHREIKNIGAVLERMSAADNPQQGKINDLLKDIAAIKSAQQEMLKGHRSSNDLNPLKHKIIFFLDAATKEMKQRECEQKADILVRIKNRKLIIFSVVSLMIGILGLAFCVRCWNGNRSLRENDLKYRYYKMTGASPQLIDSFYRKDKDAFKQNIQMMENRQISHKVSENLQDKTYMEDSGRVKKKRKR